MCPYARLASHREIGSSSSSTMRPALRDSIDRSTAKTFFVDRINKANDLTQRIWDTIMAKAEGNASRADGGVACRIDINDTTFMCDTIIISMSYHD